VKKSRGNQAAGGNSVRLPRLRRAKQPRQVRTIGIAPVLNPLAIPIRAVADLCVHDVRHRRTRAMLREQPGH